MSVEFELAKLVKATDNITNAMIGAVNAVTTRRYSRLSLESQAKNIRHFHVQQERPRTVSIALSVKSAILNIWEDNKCNPFINGLMGTGSTGEKNFW